MNLNKLNEIFNKAIETKSNYIVVTVENDIDQTIECIVFNNHFFEAKQEYYNYAYNENCKLRTFPDIFISGVQIYNEITML